MKNERRRRLVVGSGMALLAAFVAARIWRSPQVRFARMSGSSIATPGAALWVTDFLNAAYFRRPPGLRQVEDLRLAFNVVTTFWHRGGGRRLAASDVVPFHRAFGKDRFLDRTRSEYGTMTREQVLEGASRLLGDWFPEALPDDDRRGWGIVFETEEDKRRYNPEERLRGAKLGPLTPPEAPAKEQIWHTYPPVPVPSAAGVISALSKPETWPDYASEIGRFTPVRSTGLAGQTFEIEVVAHPTSRTPIFTRGYVTITRLVSQEDPAELEGYVSELNDSLARFGRDEPPAVPEGAEPVLAFDLTTHEGHFMGRARNRLVLFEQEGQAYVRAAGTWDPLPWHLDQAYRRVGHYAQHAIWGMESPQESMLHQIAEKLEQAVVRDAG